MYMYRFSCIYYTEVLSLCVCVCVYVCVVVVVPLHTVVITLMHFSIMKKEFQIHLRFDIHTYTLYIILYTCTLYIHLSECYIHSMLTYIILYIYMHMDVPAPHVHVRTLQV